MSSAMASVGRVHVCDSHLIFDTVERRDVYYRSRPVHQQRRAKTSLLSPGLQVTLQIGNESVPESVINSTINLIFKTAISILLISNRNSFRVLFDKIASVGYILLENTFLYRPTFIF